MSQAKLPAIKVFRVVVNHEEQYKVIPVDFTTPSGWKETGKSGTEAECSKYIKEMQSKSKGK